MALSLSEIVTGTVAAGTAVLRVLAWWQVRQGRAARVLEAGNRQQIERLTAEFEKQKEFHAEELDRQKKFYEALLKRCREQTAAMQAEIDRLAGPTESSNAKPGGN